jgi:hypothetical protein
MKSRRKGVKAKIDELAAVAIINMSWTREKMFQDQRVIDLDEQGVINGNMTKQEIIDAVNAA